MAITREQRARIFALAAFEQLTCGDAKDIETDDLVVEVGEDQVEEARAFITDNLEQAQRAADATWEFWAERYVGD